MGNHLLRRLALPTLLALLLCLFAGCGQSEPALLNGKELRLADGIAAYDGNQYPYQKNQGSITVTYPNGYAYSRTFYDNGSSGAWSMPLDGDLSAITQAGYPEGDELVDAILQLDPMPKDKTGGLWFAVICWLLGLWGLTSPQSMWYVGYGWRFRDAEPSDAALIAERIGGGLVILLGLIVLLL